MKIKAFSTDGYGFCRSRDVFTTGQLPSGSIGVEITDEKIHGGFQGFGVALTGSSCYLLSKMDEEKRRALLCDVYGKDGLGLSVARVSVASSDYSAELYSYEDEQGNFSVRKDEEYVLPVLRQVATTYPSVQFFASPWSPPGRMKTGGSICGGFMREGFIDEYADYIVNFVRAYEENGIHIRAITPQNEPETDQAGRMPACYWSPETEAKFAIALRKKADAQGLPFEIWLCDHHFSLWRRVLWQLDEFPELEKCVSAAAFHYYSGGVDLIENIRAKYPSLDFHFTEGGPRLYDNYATDHCKWAVAMSQALNHGLKSFTGWNLLLDETGGPNVGPFFCGGLITENSVSKELSYSGQYRAFKHFAPYVERGAEVLRVSVTGEDHGLWQYPKQKESVVACAVRNPGGSIVLELINLDVSEKRQTAISVKGETIYLELMPGSVNTVIINE